MWGRDLGLQACQVVTRVHSFGAVYFRMLPRALTRFTGSALEGAWKQLALPSSTACARAYAGHAENTNTFIGEVCQPCRFLVVRASMQMRAHMTYLGAAQRACSADGAVEHAWSAPFIIYSISNTNMQRRYLSVLYGRAEVHFLDVLACPSADSAGRALTASADRVPSSHMTPLRSVACSNSVCCCCMRWTPDWLQAFGILDLPQETEKMLLTPQREVAVELIITRDDGNPESFMGYRVQHDDSRGPYKVLRCDMHALSTRRCNTRIARNVGSPFGVRAAAGREPSHLLASSHCVRT